MDAASVWFTTKFLFQKHPLGVSLAALAIDWTLTATALNLLERGGTNGGSDAPTLLSASDAAWLTIVTMTSVGYGEIAPATLGSLVSLLLVVALVWRYGVCCSSVWAVSRTSPSMRIY